MAYMGPRIRFRSRTDRQPGGWRSPDDFDRIVRTVCLLELVGAFEALQRLLGG